MMLKDQQKRKDTLWSQAPKMVGRAPPPPPEQPSQQQQQQQQQQPQQRGSEDAGTTTSGAAAREPGELRVQTNAPSPEVDNSGADPPGGRRAARGPLANLRGDARSLLTPSPPPLTPVPDASAASWRSMLQPRGGPDDPGALPECRTSSLRRSNSSGSGSGV